MNTPTPRESGEPRKSSTVTMPTPQPTGSYRNEDLSGVHESVHRFQTRDAAEDEEIKKRGPLAEGATFGIGSRGDSTRYRVEEAIGNGGNGYVYRVVDTEHGTVKALKVSIAPDNGDPAELAKIQESFKREVTVTDQLQGAHLVKIYSDLYELFTTKKPNGSYEHSIMHVSLMRLYNGGDLRGQIEKGHVAHLLPHQKLGLVADVCDGLAELHTVAAHGDMKPENVFLSIEAPDRKKAPENETKQERKERERQEEAARDPKKETWKAHIADFGLSLHREHAYRLESRKGNLIIGTPGYVSPDQARRGGVGIETDDMFALGVIAYEILTGGQFPYPTKDEQGRKLGAQGLILGTILNENKPLTINDREALAEAVAKNASGSAVLAEALEEFGTEIFNMVGDMVGPEAGRPTAQAARDFFRRWHTLMKEGIRIVQDRSTDMGGKLKKKAIRTVTVSQEDVRRLTENGDIVSEGGVLKRVANKADPRRAMDVVTRFKVATEILVRGQVPDEVLKSAAEEAGRVAEGAPKA